MPVAPNVCITCRSRKKACDKQLPQCGFCKRRGFLCQYNCSDHANSPTIAARGLRDDTLGLNLSGSLVNFTIPGVATGSDLASAHCAVDDTVHKVLETLGIGFDEITDHYFRSFHPWFPVIPPGIAIEVNVPHRADTAVLLLAMCLASYPSVSEDLYTSLRMLFTQAQISICASLSLVQTQLLIAAYEYSKGWFPMAAISLAHGASMASVLGIDRPQGKDPRHSDQQSVSESLEAYKVGWGIVILERAISSDRLENHNSSTVSFLERDNGPPIGLNAERSTYADNTGHLGHSGSNGGAVESFGRLPEATYLLHRVIEFRRHLLQSPSSSEMLEILDRELQALLERLLEEERIFRRPRANEIAVTVRSMFILHQTNLALPINATTDENRQKSWAVLNTATNIVVDAAKNHTAEDMTTHAHLALPLCCACNLRDARQYLSTSHFYRSKDSRLTASRSLTSLEHLFIQRWRLSSGKRSAGTYEDLS